MVRLNRRKRFFGALYGKITHKRNILLKHVFTSLWLNSKRGTRFPAPVYPAMDTVLLILIIYLTAKVIHYCGYHKDTARCSSYLDLHLEFDS
jgi:hypothetical protein